MDYALDQLLYGYFKKEIALDASRLDVISGGKDVTPRRKLSVKYSFGVWLFSGGFRRGSVGSTEPPFEILCTELSNQIL